MSDTRTYTLRQVCPVIGKYVANLSSRMPDDQRQRLAPYMHRIAGSRSAEHEQVRAEILARGAVRILAPMVFDEVGLTDCATRLRSLPDDCKPEDTVRAAARATTHMAPSRRRTVAWTAAVSAGIAVQAVLWKVGVVAEGAALEAATETVEAVAAAAELCGSAAWDAALALLDEALSAGPQGSQGLSISPTKKEENCNE